MELDPPALPGGLFYVLDLATVRLRPAAMWSGKQARYRLS